MKLSLDIHGVIDAKPELFSFLSKAVIDAGGEVHILTGGTISKELIAELKRLGIEWTALFSVYDHLIERGVVTVGEVIFPDGTIQFKFEDGHWDQVKAEYCIKHNIDLHLDDTMIYNDHFKTPFARFWSHNGKEKCSKKDKRLLD